jgi:hypothetical protein
MVSWGFSWGLHSVRTPPLPVKLLASQWLFNATRFIHYSLHYRGFLVAIALCIKSYLATVRRNSYGHGVICTFWFVSHSPVIWRSKDISTLFSTASFTSWFLGAFVKLWKATVTFVMFVCPSVRPCTTTHEVWYLCICEVHPRTGHGGTKVHKVCYIHYFYICVFEDLLMLFHFLNFLILSLNSCMTKGISIIFTAAIYLGFYGILR